MTAWEKQMRLNLARRSWEGACVLLLGSDYRASGNAAYTLRYVSQMLVGGQLKISYSISTEYPIPYFCDWVMLHTLAH